MKNLFTRFLGILMLLGITVTVVYSVPPSNDDNFVLKPTPGQVLNKTNTDKAQSDDTAPIVFFNNIVDPSMQQDNFVFYHAYWKHVNGDYDSEQYKNDVAQFSFSDETLANIKVADHEVYFFPMGEMPLWAKTQGGGITIISFIKKVLDSGKRVVIFGHQLIRTSTSNTVTDDFIKNTLGIEYIGLRPTCVVSGGSKTWHPYPAYGKDNDPLGLNTLKGLNGKGQKNGNEYPAIIQWDEVEVFKSKDEVKYPTFDYLANTFNKPVAIRTDSAFGIRTILKNKARIIFYSYGLENMWFSTDMQQLIHACIVWSKQNIADDGPLLDVAGGNEVEFGYIKVGASKEKGILIQNIGIEDLKITKIYFDDSFDNIFYPVDENGDNYESDLIKKTFTIKPGNMTTINIKFSPKDVGESYLRSMYIKTNEMKLDGSGIGRVHTINFFGTGGDKVYEGSYLSYNYEKIDFGSVELGQTVEKFFEISNKGLDDLHINAIKFAYDSSGSFSLPASQMKQHTVAPGSYITLTVRFKPTDTLNHSAWLELYTDATNQKGTKFSVPLSGYCFKKPDTTSQAIDEINIPEGMFKMSVSPNPAGESAIVSYTWNSAMTCGMVLKLADINGNIVRTLYDNIIESGTNTLNINTANIASGNYSILAEIRGKVARLPLVIVK